MASASPICYVEISSRISINSDFNVYGNSTSSVPGTHAPCCINGDQYLSNNFCVNSQSFYVAGCTDSTYKDGACSSVCGSNDGLYVYYGGLDTWYCCGINFADCGTSDRISFHSPTDDDIVASAGLSTGVTLSYTTILPTSSLSASIVTTSLSSASSTSRASGTSSTGPTRSTGSVVPVSKAGSRLSSGAIAGISIAGVVLILLTVAAVFLMRRKRKQQPAQYEAPTPNMVGPEQPGSFGSPESLGTEIPNVRYQQEKGWRR